MATLTQTSCAIVFRFSDECKLFTVVNYVKNRLENEGLAVEEFNRLYDSPKETVLTVKACKSLIDKTGDYLELLKLSLDNEYQEFDMCQLDKFQNSESDRFWLPSEEGFLLQYIINNVTTDILFNELTPSQNQDVNTGDFLIPSCLRMELITQVSLLHNEGKHHVWNQTLFAHPFEEEHLELIYKYYGSHVALYFAWMNHFTRWLFIPGLLGLIIWLHNYLDETVSMDNSYLAPFFATFMIFWGVLFVKYWSRRSSVLACRWGTLTGQSALKMKLKRPQFRGELRTSPITGQPERHFAWSKRLKFYAFSCLITGVMLFIAFAIMVISLNFQGYIHRGSVGAKYVYFSTIGQFSQPGRIFDPAGDGPLPWILPFVPTICHSCLILLLNKIYREIATILTELENHEFEDVYQDSLITKRFFFEAFDCYIALFYLAFLQLDIVLLRAELISLYTADSIRRITTETLIPLIANLLHSKKEDKLYSKSKKIDSPTSDHSALFKELSMDEYDQFDDFLEMIMEFGYITLFACAFPLGSILSILCNFIEMKSDLFKLTYVVQRPAIQRRCNLGRWESFIAAWVFLSMLTNVFIFGFTTEQLMQVFPWLFKVEQATESLEYGGSNHAHMATLGYGRWLVGVIFLLEHVFILIAKAIYEVVPDMPGKVVVEMERRWWIKERAARMQRAA